MANWVRVLDLSDVYHQTDDGLMSISALSKIVADRLTALEPVQSLQIDLRIDFDESRRELVDQFRMLADDPDADAGDFDAVMRQLYDWGDTALDDHWNGKKLCWIKTF